MSSIICLSQPKITSISPQRGVAGTVVTINGNGFNTTFPNTVQFGAVKANIQSINSNKLTVIAPVSASYESITVFSQGLTAVGVNPFVLASVIGDTRTLNAKSFANGRYYSTGASSPRSIITEDLNNDGLADIIVTNQGTNQITIFRNLSNSSTDSLAPPVLLTAGPGTFALAMGDLNGDGKKDIVTTNANNGNVGTISIFLNTSDTTNGISFANKIDSTTGDGATSVQISDINGDGKLDIITASGNSGALHYYINTSSGGIFRLEPVKTINTVPHRVEYITLTDMNADGLPDIISSYGTTIAGIRIMINTSTLNNISFANPVSFPITTGLGYKVMTPDLDMDGKPDVVVSFINNPKIFIYRNNSSQNTLQLDSVMAITAFANIGALGISDIDGDGFPDILVPNRDSNTVSIFTNKTTNNGIKFSNPFQLESKQDPVSVYASDLNGDGMPEIIIPNFQSGNINIFRNNIRAPKISTFLPAVAKRLDTLQIKGMDFMRASQVSIGGIPVNFSVVSDSLITVLISKGLVSGRIMVTNPFGSDTLNGFTYKVVPKIQSFTPQTGGYGDTITIRGYNFTGSSGVQFQDSAALSFQVVSDSLIRAVVGKGGSGFLKLLHPNGNDSASGFIYMKPTISINTLNNGFSFTALKSVATAAQSYRINARNLWDNITINTPNAFEISRSADNGYTKSLILTPTKGSIDSTVIYVRMKTDSTSGNFSDSITNSSPGAIAAKVAVTGNVCDSIIFFKPVINNITNDSSIVCFKDSITLSVTNRTGLSRYRWSTGDTTASVRLTNTSGVSVRVGNSAACMSLSSPLVRFVKNTNTKPSLAMVGDTSLVSTQAPHYRWYFNNKATNDSSVSIAAKRVGFYRVETSNDKLCWDASNDFAVVVAANSMASDSVAVKIFPNPASGGFFNVVATLERVTSVIARVTVTDANGIVLLQTNKFLFFGKEIKIPVTLSTYKGTAFVRLELNGKVETKTIVLL